MTSDSSPVPASLLHHGNDPQVHRFCQSLGRMQPEVRGQGEEEVLTPKWRGFYDLVSGSEEPVMCASRFCPQLGLCALEWPKDHHVLPGGLS